MTSAHQVVFDQVTSNLEEFTTHISGKEVRLKCYTCLEPRSDVYVT